jgi:hypothetical protein
MKYLFLLLLSLNANAQIIQSHDITTIYGESIASYSGRITLYKIRNTTLDRYDNTPHIIETILQKYDKVDNLTTIGFDQLGSKNLFDRRYADIVLPIIKQYRDTKIEVLCSTTCLPIGNTFKVTTVRQVRKHLIGTRGKTIVVSLTSLWDEDRNRWIYLNDVTAVFAPANNFIVSPLFQDTNSHLHFWINPVDVHNGSMIVQSRINLKQIMQLPDAESLLRVTEKLKVKAQ